MGSRAVLCSADGEWWQEEDHRWRPPGDALPVVWQTRLFNGSRTTARITGPFHHSLVDHPEIARAAAASDDTRHLWAHLSTRQMDATPFKVDWLLSTPRPDGSIIYYLEGWKDYGGLLDTHRQLRVSAVATRSRAGTFHTDGLSATGVYDDYISHTPLAAEETAFRDCDWN